MRIKKILIEIYEEIYGFPLVMKCLFAKMFNPKTIALKGFFIMKNWKISNFNWGDDLNYYLFNEITNNKIVLLPDTKLVKILNLENYLCIGSTIMSFDMKNTVVWGTGLLNDKMGFTLQSKPKKILAVRGPLTRRWLLEQGVDCPEVYGDPALLLPQFYKPIVREHYRMGIIPHYKDVDNVFVNRFSNLEDVHMIKISGYGDWHSFIDQINECDFIISSSLHGIIVSEAYNKPVLWVKFDGSDYVLGWDFKFHDFYASINKKNILPQHINENTTIEKLEDITRYWTPGVINIKELLGCCPLELK